jgi:murein endopeptidase
MRRVAIGSLFACACAPEAIAVARSAPRSEVPSTVVHELRGDPAAAEREILAVADAEIAEDLLLGLPGSHGLPVAAQANGRVPIPEGGQSVGSPTAGTLEGGVQLPFDPALYTRRDATRSYATTQTLRTLQAALGRLRSDKGFDAEVIIGDLSLPKGGSFVPHVSHTSGRDIDIRLVLAPGLDRTTLPLAPEQVDWDATWALVVGFLETGQVSYVFLDFAQQEQLFRAGERAGVHTRVLDRWFQWPDAAKDDAIVRHEPGHRAHFHVRLGCDGQGPRCRE